MAIAVNTFAVMAGLVPAIHAFAEQQRRKTWMPGTRPGMTESEKRTTWASNAGSSDCRTSASRRCSTR
ncbi:hypothetical protein DU475_15145 [Rhodopseudomonas sp. WA056]|nr:hypothetical protein [Rhodopseudomonas sp. WA056]